MTPAKTASKRAGGDDQLVSSAFGQRNRERLLKSYFDTAEAVTTASVWRHVYRLLLWTDQTTGLAHCYESDKCQPGKPWYARSLAFHSWLADEFDTRPTSLSDQLDWLFQRAASELAAEVVRKSSALAAAATRQRGTYSGRDFPEPGTDPEVATIVRRVLGAHLVSEPTPELWRALVQQLRQYFSLDNKRKNLLGEGFEDVIGALARRLCPPQVEVHTRRLLQELPGFLRERRGDKRNKVDLAIVRPQMRTLVTAKWSVRADREKQFVVDFTDYAAAESDGKPFEYVFVTNEFDPARLMRACEKLAANSYMFANVVHISTDALRATYGRAPQEESMQKVLGFIDSGRLVDLEEWFARLAT